MPRESKAGAKQLYSALIGISALSGQAQPVSPQSQPAALIQTIQTPLVAQPTTNQKPARTDSNSDLSNNTYYTNTYGNEVHSPAYTENGSVPAGASAQCRDGTYSFSEHRQGTCSHHGGVEEWEN